MMKRQEMIVASTRSTTVSLEAIRRGVHGLNDHRRRMLALVPNSGDWERFSLNTIEHRDLAYLTASTGHEFALLRGKQEDIFFHGSQLHCQFDDALVDMLLIGKLSLECHSHPGEMIPIPTRDDLETLVMIGQFRSTIISGITGKETSYTTEEYMG